MTRLEQVIAQSQRLATTTKAQYQMVVRLFIDSAGVSPSGWNAAAVETWRAGLTVRPISKNLYLAAIQYASRRRAALDDVRDFAAAVETVLVPAEKHPRGPRVLTEREVLRILATTDRGEPRDLRDRAIIVLGLHAGLRRAELARIDFTDLDADCMSVVVVAKRNRRHVVRVSEGAWATLDAWLTWLRRRHVRDGRVFRGLRRHLDAELGFVVGRSMTPGGLYAVIRRRAARAGIHGVSPHSLRHTCASLLRERGVPEELIRRRLGHAALATTARYGGDIVVDAGDVKLPV